MDAPVQPGDVVEGKYLVERVIGSGGAGVVAAAVHKTLRQRVALKFLRSDLVADPEAMERLVREAQAVAQLRNEHIARVMDVSLTEGRLAFIVMEFLEGRDLAAVLKESGPLAVADAVDYAIQACEGLAEAHALGIIHRDIKPANLFLTHGSDGSPLVKLLDFGLSKVITAAGATSLTADHHVLGSPHFMSPEQMRASRYVDERSDIWAIGAVLYTLLAGRVPFEGEYLTQVCAAVVSGDFCPLGTVRPDAPSGLVEVVHRCMRLDPGERFPSAVALVQALTPWAKDGAALAVARVERVWKANAVPALQATLPGQVSLPPHLATPPPGAAVPPLPPPLPPVRPPTLTEGSSAVQSMAVSFLRQPDRSQARRIRRVALAGVMAGALVGVALMLRSASPPPRSRAPEPSAVAAPSIVTPAPPASAPSADGVGATGAVSAAPLAKVPSPSPHGSSRAAAVAGGAGGGATSAKRAGAPASKVAPVPSSGATKEDFILSVPH